MKNLILIRHAKSSWNDVSLDDRERPLGKRGKKDAPHMGCLLKEKDLRPDRILSSPAKRALKTAKLIAKEIGYAKKDIILSEELYEHGPDALAEVVAGLDDGWDRVFLFGHNPELTDFANRLTGANIGNIPTCGIVSIEFAEDHWHDCAHAGGKLALFERPAKPRPDALTPGPSPVGRGE